MSDSIQAASAPQGDLLTDEEIVSRVVNGDTPLYEILMRRYNRRVYRTVRGILRDDSEAEDVMQQAWVNAYVHLAQFEQRAKFSTWLTRIAVHEAFARTRKRGGTLQLVTESDAEEGGFMEIISPSPDPEQEAMSSELKSVLETQIAMLPEAYRAVLMLREVEGLSTSETADCLDVSEDVIKQRLHRARGMLRERLYERAQLSFDTLFPFLGPRCDAMVAAVMKTISELH